MNLFLAAEAGGAESVQKLWQAIEGVLPGIAKFAWHLLLAVLLWTIGKKVIRWLIRLLKKWFERRNTEISVRKFMEMLVTWVLYALLLFQIVSVLGVNTASIVALLGSAGLAIGLAVQGSLSNFAGGVLILMLKPFTVGDYIVDGSGTEGTVTLIGLFYTRLATVDNQQVNIPNGTLANGTITNVTIQDKRRIVIRVGIGYQADLKKAKEILYRVMTERDSVLQEEEKLVVVSALESGAVTLMGRVWVPSDVYWTEYWNMLEEVKLAFDAEGIEIPYNQLDVHIKEEKQ